MTSTPHIKHYISFQNGYLGSHTVQFAHRPTVHLGYTLQKQRAQNLCPCCPKFEQSFTFISYSCINIFSDACHRVSQNALFWNSQALSQFWIYLHLLSISVPKLHCGIVDRPYCNLLVYTIIMSHNHISINRYNILPILTLTSLLILHTRRGTCKPSVHVNPALTKIVGVVFIISTFPG